MPVKPPINVPLTDESGLVTDAWQGFFTDLVGSSGAIEAPAIGASPFTYNPPATGHALLTGGTSVSARIVRGRISIVVPATTFVPVSLGDSLIITYAAPPSLRFFPE